MNKANGNSDTNVESPENEEKTTAQSDPVSDRGSRFAIGTPRGLRPVCGLRARRMAWRGGAVLSLLSLSLVS